jgi:preprotein translocase subunit SecA
LRGYGQRDPLNEYSREAFGLFPIMLDSVRETVVKTLMRAEVRMPTLEEYIARHPREMQELHGPSPDEIATGAPLPEGLRRAAAGQPAHNLIDPRNPDTWHTMPRNAPCPCGSGKKYKHCHGAAG